MLARAHARSSVILVNMSGYFIDIINKKWGDGRIPVSFKAFFLLSSFGVVPLLNCK